MYPEYILTAGGEGGVPGGPPGLHRGCRDRGQVRLEGRRHLPARERHPALPGGAALRLRDPRHLPDRRREVPRHRRPDHVLPLEVPLRIDPAARRGRARSRWRSPIPRRPPPPARPSTRCSRTRDRQTKTETEAAFRAGFVSLAGNLAVLLNGIGLAVTFTILLVTANTMSMAVRERRTEIAVLKTLGFGSGLVMALILAEAVLLGILGGGVGLGLSRAHDQGPALHPLRRRRGPRVPEPGPLAPRWERSASGWRWRSVFSRGSSPP